MDELNISQICILCTKSISDGRIGEFFSSRGVIKTFTGMAIGEYYFSNGKTILVSKKKPEFRQLINPWKKPRRKFPREMLVSNDKIYWAKWKVFAKLNNTPKPYLTCWPSGYHYQGWEYAKEIDQTRQ